MPLKDLDAARQYRRDWKRKRAAEDPDWSVKQNHIWRASNPKGYMISRARGRAKIEGSVFNITIDDFEIPEFCPVFPDIKLEFSMGRRTRPDNIPTLDKRIPALGYIPGNVHVISMRANRLKSDSSLEELKTIVRWLESYELSPYHDRSGDGD